MKRLFIVISMGCFTAAEAQQNEIFRIDDYLKKKPSKPLSAISPFQKNKATIKIIPGQLSFAYALPNGDRVYTSPLFKMPVIKPGNNFIYNMPTFYLHGISDSLLPNPGKIPNAAIKNHSLVFN